MTRRPALVCALLLAVVPACKRRHAAKPEYAVAHAPVEPSAGDGQGNGEGGGGDNDEEPAGGRRFHDATVYVDGVPVVAFTYNEMPPGVKVFKKEWDEGEFFSHFLVCDYFAKLGVDC